MAQSTKFYAGPSRFEGMLKMPTFSNGGKVWIRHASGDSILHDIFLTLLAVD
jgi:hypothetical protein